jgi:hypothetical protein
MTATKATNSSRCETFLDVSQSAGTLPPMSAEPPGQPQLSEDGKFYWDSQRWVPLPTAHQAATPAPTVHGSHRILKAVGVSVLVFVVWLIGAFIVSAITHVGETYDAAVGAWFTDPSQDNVTAQWLGNAVFIGVVVALFCGAVFYVAPRRPKTPAVPETQEERDARITGRAPSGTDPRA